MEDEKKSYGDDDVERRSSPDPDADEAGDSGIGQRRNEEEAEASSETPTLTLAKQRSTRIFNNVYEIHCSDISTSMPIVSIESIHGWCSSFCVV